jgi:hypothetical protein
MVTFEAIIAMLGVALVTGITFSKFAKPTARVLFSDKVVIGPRNGIPHLMFRMANWRRNNIFEATLHVILLVEETTDEGQVMRRPYRRDEPLLRSRCIRSPVRGRSPVRAARDFARQYGWTRVHANVGYCVNREWRRATAGSESNHENVTVRRS